MFKFSLRLCIWLVLLVGSVLGLVLDRDSWVFEPKELTHEEFQLRFPNVIARWRLNEYPDESPDRTRTFYSEKEGKHERAIRDLKTQEVLFEFEGDYVPWDFYDDNTVILFWMDLMGDKSQRYLIMHRHYPEWWWGIFYRPFFWIAVIVSVGTVFEFESMRKRLRTG